MAQQHLFICRQGGKHEATSRIIIMVLLVQFSCIRTCILWLVMISVSYFHGDGYETSLCKLLFQIHCASLNCECLYMCV